MHARSRPLVGKYAFWVRDLTQGIVQAKFSTATGGGMTINIGEHAEGGAQAPMKEGTTATFDNLTLTHGVIESSELYDWVIEVIDMLKASPYGKGVASPGQLRNLAVDQYRRDRTVLYTKEYYNCQPANFDPGDNDNTSTEIQVETLEIAFEYFDRREEI
jgi:phage tail-like protein